MNKRAKFKWIGFVFFGLPSLTFGWGALEHSSITAAAVSVLSPAVLAFLGSEAARLIKIYCNYPDFNWAVYGTCSKTGDGTLRVPDERRDFEASYYCDFDEFTGRGSYFGHGPEIGKEMPPPDEHAKFMYERGDFSSRAVRKFIRKTCAAFEKGDYFEAVRFTGVVVHYLEDNTPPPHTLGIPGGFNKRHHDMEAISDHSRIGIRNYASRVFAGSAGELAASAPEFADRLAQEAQVIARSMLALLDQGKQREVENQTLACANLAARAVADLLTTLHVIYQSRLPERPVSQPDVNLLFNPSFDLDSDGDLQPDGWIREWYDLSCPYDMHLLDRVSTRGKGACVRLYNTSKAGAAWRTARTRAIPVKPGETYELKGLIRAQVSSGENYLALGFQDADYRIVAETISEKLGAPCEWRELTVSAPVPREAVDLIASCVSKGNSGSVLFDNLALRRMS